PYDIGGTTSAALSAAAIAPTCNRASAAGRTAKTDSQANGSLMRISPVGIFAAGRPELASELARSDSALTHPNPVCVAATSAYSAAIAVGVAGGTRAEMLVAAKAYAGQGEGAQTVRQWLKEAAAGVPKNFSANMGWVRLAFVNAFHLLDSGCGVEEGIIATVGRGGDTDTNAAIAGALLGAADGRSALPSRWIMPILSCRSLPDSGTRRPRPDTYWPDDALALAETLLAAGGFSGRKAGVPHPAASVECALPSDETMQMSAYLKERLLRHGPAVDRLVRELRESDDPGREQIVPALAFEAADFVWAFLVAMEYDEAKQSRCMRNKVAEAISAELGKCYPPLPGNLP
ncbi:MAG: ADP-ribosylglycohydrolase family protein, partial [Rhodospirillaceae bacterium]